MPTLTDRVTALEQRMEAVEKDIADTRALLEGKIDAGIGHVVNQIELVDQHLSQQYQLLSDRIGGRGLLLASVAGGLVGVIAGLASHAL